MRDLYTHFTEYKDLLKSEDYKAIAEEVDISILIDNWDNLEEEQAVMLFMHLDLETKADLITELNQPEQEKLLLTLSEHHIRQLLEEMEPDDLVDIIQTVSHEVRKSVWENLSDESKKELLFLLRFDEDDAAGIMTPRYLAIRSNLTVGQALAFLRQNATDIELLYYIYIVDNLQRLSGVVSIKDILSAKDNELIRDIMEDDLIYVHEETDQEEVAKTLETYDLISLPVTDNLGRLLGIVTFDDVIDVIREEQTEDVYKMGAMHGGIERYLDSSIFRLMKRRVPWIIILLLLGTISTNVLAHYEAIFVGATFLTIFLPVIIQTGGNSGSQSSTLMIRSLATGEIHFRDLGKVILKEFAVGILIGISAGAVIILRSIFLPPGIEWLQAAIIGLALVFIVLFSSLVGALAPMLLNKIGQDPTVASGPLMSTIIDVMGMTLYFEIAKIFLSLG